MDIEKNGARVKKHRVVEGKTLIPLETAIALAVALIGIPATFFATKSALEARIATLESALEIRLTMQDELDRALFVKQRNQLKALAVELQRLRAICMEWKKPVFGYAAAPSFPPGAPPLEVLTSVEGDASAINMIVLGPLMFDAHFLAIHDGELIRETMQVFMAVDAYNAAIQMVTGPAAPAGQYGGMRPRITAQMRAPRPLVQDAEVAMERAIGQLKVALNGANFDTAIAREITRIEGLVDRPD